jgi:Methyltransferase small domain
MSHVAMPEHALSLRKAAERMQGQLEKKRQPAFVGQRATPRRARIVATKAAEARTLETIQTALLKLAEGHENGGVPEPLALVKDSKVTASLVATLEWLERDRDNATTYRDTSYLRPARYYYKVIDDSKALERAGIHNEEAFEVAVQTLKTMLESDLEKAQRERKLEDLERSLIGNRIPGFFETPEPLLQHLLELADLRDGQRVLEPSAGSGSIAQKLRSTCNNLSVIELNYTLRELLELKGFKVVAQDFLKHFKTYDRIVMNPPFEKLHDIDHVRHAYSLLNANGRLVSVMSESVFFRRETKAESFRAWLEEVAARVENNPPDAFKASGTNVQTRTVVIDKR